MFSFNKVYSTIIILVDVLSNYLSLLLSLRISFGTDTVTDNIESNTVVSEGLNFSTDQTEDVPTSTASDSESEVAPPTPWVRNHFRGPEVIIQLGEESEMEEVEKQNFPPRRWSDYGTFKHFPGPQKASPQLKKFDTNPNSLSLGLENENQTKLDIITIPKVFKVREDHWVLSSNNILNNESVAAIESINETDDDGDSLRGNCGNSVHSMSSSFESNSTAPSIQSFPSMESLIDPEFYTGLRAKINSLSKPRSVLHVVEFSHSINIDDISVDENSFETDSATSRTAEFEFSFDN
ncbi:hypothetical protein BY996DRAFT_7290738, partial [Phakopsora pachyrhizi]